MSRLTGEDRSVGFLLGRAHRRHRALWEDRLGPLGLTAPRAAVLRLVAQHPGCSQRDVARELATDPMNARRLVADLATRGLLTRERAARDRRREQLRLTDAGHRLASRVAGEAQELTTDLAARLGLERYATLSHLLAAFDSVLDLDRPDTAPAAARRTTPAGAAGRQRVPTTPDGPVAR